MSENNLLDQVFAKVKLPQVKYTEGDSSYNTHVVKSSSSYESSNNVVTQVTTKTVEKITSYSGGSAPSEEVTSSLSKTVFNTLSESEGAHVTNGISESAARLASEVSLVSRDENEVLQNPPTVDNEAENVVENEGSTATVKDQKENVIAELKQRQRTQSVDSDDTLVGAEAAIGAGVQRLSASTDQRIGQGVESFFTHEINTENIGHGVEAHSESQIGSGVTQSQSILQHEQDLPHYIYLQDGQVVHDGIRSSRASSRSSIYKPVPLPRGAQQPAFDQLSQGTGTLTKAAKAIADLDKVLDSDSVEEKDQSFANGIQSIDDLQKYWHNSGEPEPRGLHSVRNYGTTGSRNRFSISSNVFTPPSNDQAVYIASKSAQQSKASLAPVSAPQKPEVKTHDPSYYDTVRFVRDVKSHIHHVGPMAVPAPYMSISARNSYSRVGPVIGSQLAGQITRRTATRQLPPTWIQQESPPQAQNVDNLAAVENEISRQFSHLAEHQIHPDHFVKSHEIREIQTREIPIAPRVQAVVNSRSIGSGVTQQYRGQSPGVGQGAALNSSSVIGRGVTQISSDSIGRGATQNSSYSISRNTTQNSSSSIGRGAGSRIVAETENQLPFYYLSPEEILQLIRSGKAFVVTGAQSQLENVPGSRIESRSIGSGAELKLATRQSLGSGVNVNGSISRQGGAIGSGTEIHRGSIGRGAGSRQSGIGSGAEVQQISEIHRTKTLGSGVGVNQSGIGGGTSVARYGNGVGIRGGQEIGTGSEVNRIGHGVNRNFIGLTIGQGAEQSVVGNGASVQVDNYGYDVNTQQFYNVPLHPSEDLLIYQVPNKVDKATSYTSLNQPQPGYASTRRLISPIYEDEAAVDFAPEAPSPSVAEIRNIFETSAGGVKKTRSRVSSNIGNIVSGQSHYRN